jgi:predicted DNA-binding WGR domain protein
MEETKTYLELSENDGGSHKFYEVSVADTQVTIRYGRIGDEGQTKVSSFATPEKAQADATKKINDKVRNQFRLANGVKCLVADDSWIYAGCDDSKVYDLGGKAPRVAYEIAQNVDIYWLDIKDGILGVSDAQGNITTINHEDESQWSQWSSGTSGWMVRCDEIGVFHGHSKGVTMYDWEDGTQIWHQETAGSVLFGWQEETTVYAGTSDNKVYCFTKKGKLEATIKKLV